MDIKTQIDKKTNLRRHKVTGTPTGDSFLAALNKIYSMPEVKPGMNALWDFRDVEVSSFSSSEVEELADFFSTHWGARGPRRAAVVVSQDLAFGLTRMFEIFLGGRTSSDLHVFRDYAEALKWVNAPG